METTQFGDLSSEWVVQTIWVKSIFIELFREELFPTKLLKPIDISKKVVDKIGHIYIVPLFTFVSLCFYQVKGKRLQDLGVVTKPDSVLLGGEEDTGGYRGQGNGLTGNECRRTGVELILNWFSRRTERELGSYPSH